MPGVDLGTLIEGAILAAILWQGRTLREVAGIIKLHEWRLAQLEQRAKCDLPSILKEQAG